MLGEHGTPKFRALGWYDSWASIHKMYMNPYLTPCSKINSKRITELSVRSKTIKPLEKKQVSPHEFGLSNTFLDMTLIMWAMKFKMYKLDLKLKILWFKEHHKKVEENDHED